jgi:hypothetical protein
MASRIPTNQCSDPGLPHIPTAWEGGALLLLAILAISPEPHRASQSPWPESIPDTVARLEAEALRLSEARQEFERKLGEQAQALAELEQELSRARTTLNSALGEARSLLRDGPASHELVLTHGEDHADLRCSKGSVALALSSEAHDAKAELSATTSGGVLKFSRGTKETARLGTDSKETAGVLELAVVARLGSQSRQRGGGLTLSDRKGQDVVILGTTADGSGLVLGNPDGMKPDLPPDRQRGIILSMTSKGSLIQIDGRRHTGN